LANPGHQCTVIALQFVYNKNNQGVISLKYGSPIKFKSKSGFGMKSLLYLIEKVKNKEYND